MKGICEFCKLCEFWDKYFFINFGIKLKTCVISSKWMADHNKCQNKQYCIALYKCKKNLQKRYVCFLVSELFNFRWLYWTKVWFLWTNETTKNNSNITRAKRESNEILNQRKLIFLHQLIAIFESVKRFNYKIRTQRKYKHLETWIHMKKKQGNSVPNRRNGGYKRWEIWIVVVLECVQHIQTYSSNVYRRIVDETWTV